MCSIVADAVRTDLFKAGFVTNEDKSCVDTLPED